MTKMDDDAPPECDVYVKDICAKAMLAARTFHLEAVRRSDVGRLRAADRCACANRPP